MISEEEVIARTREIEGQRQVAEGLRELLAVVNTGGSLNDILNVTLGQATRSLQSDAGAVYLVGSRPGVVFLRATLGHAPGDMLQELQTDASVTGAAVAYERPVVCDVLQAFPARSPIPTETEVADRGAYVQILRVGGAALRRKDVDRMRRVGKRYRTMLSVPLTATNRTCGAWDSTTGTTPVHRGRSRASKYLRRPGHTSHPECPAPRRDGTTSARNRSAVPGRRTDLSD